MKSPPIIISLASLVLEGTFLEGTLANCSLSVSEMFVNIGNVVTMTYGIIHGKWTVASRYTNVY